MYAAYVTSFITIGIIWINHHVMIRRLREPDHMILFLNLLLLMSIAVLPFAASLMAAYLQESRVSIWLRRSTAESFLLMAVCFAALNAAHLARQTAPAPRAALAARRRQILVRSVTGVIPYAIATALAAVSSYVTLAICAGLGVFYAFPISSGGSPAE